MVIKLKELKIGMIVEVNSNMHYRCEIIEINPKLLPKHPIRVKFNDGSKCWMNLNEVVKIVSYPKRRSNLKWL